MGADAGVQGWSEEMSNRAIEGAQSLINECLHLRAEVAKIRGMVADLSRKLMETQLLGPDLGGEG